MAKLTKQIVSTNNYKTLDKIPLGTIFCPDHSPDRQCLKISTGVHRFGYGEIWFLDLDTMKLDHDCRDVEVEILGRIL